LKNGLLCSTNRYTEPLNGSSFFLRYLVSNSITCSSKGKIMLARSVVAGCLLSYVVALPLQGATGQMTTGKVDLQSAGPMAFGPSGLLFVGDPKSAAVFAIETDDTAGSPDKMKLNVAGIDQKIAAMLGTTADDILISDLAVNPSSGQAYLSVSRGRGPDAQPVILRVDGAGEISEVSLAQVNYSKATLPDAPADAMQGEGRRQQNPRTESITDLAYLDGKVIVAGLSNEEFASKLRSIPYPFAGTNTGASIEIYHASHGQFETRSPVRTFAAYNIDDTPTLLAAYTCTPLVKIPVAMLDSGEKIRGETIAELGNRNRPLDMIIYSKAGSDYILMANSARGLMKIPTADIANIEGLTERVRETAGIEFETIDGIAGVEQLDRLNAMNALVLVRQEGGGYDLQTIELP
jgi:hypothetical protein